MAKGQSLMQKACCSVQRVAAVYIVLQLVCRSVQCVAAVLVYGVCSVLHCTVCCSCKQCVAACRALLRRRRASVRWLRLVDSLKTKVSSAKEPYKRDDIMKKRRIFLRSLLIIATPHAQGQSPPAFCALHICAYMCTYI